MMTSPLMEMMKNMIMVMLAGGADDDNDDNRNESHTAGCTGKLRLIISVLQNTMCICIHRLNMRSDQYHNISHCFQTNCL